MGEGQREEMPRGLVHLLQEMKGKIRRILARFATVIADVVVRDRDLKDRWRPFSFVYFFLFLFFIFFFFFLFFFFFFYFCFFFFFWFFFFFFFILGRGQTSATVPPLRQRLCAWRGSLRTRPRVFTLRRSWKLDE